MLTVLLLAVGHGQVDLAVAVEIAHCDGPGPIADGIVALGLECPVTVAQQNAHVLLPSLATARSVLPSPLKSPTATEYGSLPTA